jgi:hypothetical protein
LFYGKAWPLEVIRDNNNSVYGWRVLGDVEIEICERDLVYNFPTLSQHHSRYNVPHPSRLHGEIKYLCRHYVKLTV